MILNSRIVILGASITALAVSRIAARLGLHVIVAHMHEGIAMRSKYIEKLIFQSTSAESILNTLRSKVGSIPTLCIADSDEWLRFIIANREAVETIFTDVLHPSQEALSICLDKNRFLLWCRELQITAPERYTLCENGEITPVPNFPLLIRPEQTQHSSGKNLPKAIEAKNEDELYSWIRLFREQEVEPSISESLLRPGIHQYSIGFARRRDGGMWMTVAEKLRSFPDQCAGGTYVVSCQQPEVETFIRGVVEALDYYGLGEAEVMYDAESGQSYIIEINARPWVQYALSERIQPGMLNFLLNEAMDNLMENLQPNLNVQWLHFRSDLFVCFSRNDGIVRHGRLNLWSYLLSVIRANSFALFDYRDPSPFLYEFAQLAGMIWMGIRIKRGTR